MEKRFELEIGKAYGTNSAKIYLEFCDKLDWDRGPCKSWRINSSKDVLKTDCFGKEGTPLYAPNADAERKRGVWFIKELKGEFDPNKRDCNMSEDGQVITEYVDVGRERWVSMNVGDERIVFVKVAGKYVYSGVYVTMENEIVKKGETGFNRWKTQYRRTYRRNRFEVVRG